MNRIFTARERHQVAHEGKGSPRVLRTRRQAVDEHVGLRCDDRRVDETKEEEAADQGTDRVISRFGVFPLERRAFVSVHLVMAD